jgi:hypothetical protein
VFREVLPQISGIRAEKSLNDRSLLVGHG